MLKVSFNHTISQPLDIREFNGALSFQTPLSMSPCGGSCHGKSGGNSLKNHGGP